MRFAIRAFRTFNYIRLHGKLCSLKLQDLLHVVGAVFVFDRGYPDGFAVFPKRVIQVLKLLGVQILVCQSRSQLRQMHSTASGPAPRPYRFRSRQRILGGGHGSTCRPSRLSVAYRAYHRPKVAEELASAGAPLLLDVRNPREWATKHIDGSDLIP